MKNSFLLSRRCWVPLLLVMAAHLVWFGRELSTLYAADFEGKGLPAFFFWKWVWFQLNGWVFFVSFLAAFVTGISWYSHYQTRHNRQGFRPFSRKQLISLAIIILAGFYYMAYTGPAIAQKGHRILPAIVFAKNYEEYKREIQTADTLIPTPEYLLNISELLSRKKRLQSRTMDEFDNTGDRYAVDKSIRKTSFEIAKRSRVPLAILVFYVAGILMGFSFYKTFPLIPFFLSWILIALGYISTELFFQRLYYRGDTGVLIGVFGPLFVMIPVLLVWYWALRRYGFFAPERSILPDDFLSGENKG